jgi:hypothetical protein
MKASVVTMLTALNVGAAALTASASASAHYYAVLDTPTITNGDAADGNFINIQTNILHSTCNVFTHEFVNHEMWYNLDTSGHWVEVGFKDGATNGLDCVTDILFWADQSAANGYAEHHTNFTVNFNQWDTLQIGNAGSCTWNIVINGNLTIGTSTNNCPGSGGRFLLAGIESTSQTIGSAKGLLSGWWEQNASAQWNQGWDGAEPTEKQTGQPLIQWVPNTGDTQTEETLNESP